MNLLNEFYFPAADSGHPSRTGPCLGLRRASAPAGSQQHFSETWQHESLLPPEAGDTSTCHLMDGTQRSVFCCTVIITSTFHSTVNNSRTNSRTRFRPASHQTRTLSLSSSLRWTQLLTAGGLINKRNVSRAPDLPPRPLTAPYNSTWDLHLRGKVFPVWVQGLDTFHRINAAE